MKDGQHHDAEIPAENQKKVSSEGNCMEHVDRIKGPNGELLAIIVHGTINVPGVTFLTEGVLSQQLAYMQHPRGKTIDAHIHLPVKREVAYTQEVLVIRKGTLKVNFFTDRKDYLSSYILNAGDVILLIQGGHGFEVLADLEMFEVKQGPYAGEFDKERF